VADNTPILGLKKPVPNVEENWAFRLNESLDILDQSLLVGNASSIANVTTYNDGVGHLLISGSTNPVFDHVEAITFNSNYVTVSTGTFTEVNFGDTTVIRGDNLTTTSGIFDQLFVNGVESANIVADNSFKLLFHVTDRKSSGTAGGTFTATTYQTRDLNTVESNAIEGASLSANQITLPAGDYYAEFTAPAYKVNRHHAWLYRVAGNEVLVHGTSAYSASSDGVSTVSNGTGKFTLTSEVTDIEIRHRAETTAATFGYGVDSSSLFDEIYTQVRIWKFDERVTNVDHLTASSGTFTDQLTVSGVPVTIGDHTNIPDPLVLSSGTFSEELNIPHGPTTSGQLAGDFWIDPTTSGLRWRFDGVVFEAQGIEVV
jgi:hypothetical protein